MSKATEAAHPNLELLGKLADHFPGEMDKLKPLFSDNFVFHYFNSEMPSMQGSYKGVEGFGEFFTKLGSMSEGTFEVKNGEVIHIGDELIATHATPRMNLERRSFEWDALFIWRIVDGKFEEAWDIPAVNTTRTLG